MSVEALNERIQPQPPENVAVDDNQFLENLLQLHTLYRLRQRYTELSSADRISAPQEPQKSESQLLELAPGLEVIPQIKEAGYDVLMEMGRLYRNINSGVGVETASSELEVNIRTYDLEIIKSRPILPHLNRFDFKSGVLRMVGNNGEPVIDAISAQERNGSVLEASRNIENFLLSGENNSFAVLMNPAGWNGFKGADGQEAEPHLNAEVMVFWKDQSGELKGVTLVADLLEEQARKTMVSLGISEQLLKGQTEHERLANMVRNPALLSLPEAYTNPFMYVLDKMLAQRGNGGFKLRMRDGTIETRSLDIVKKDIARFEELLLLSQEEEKLAAEPKRYILENAARLNDRSVQQEIINKTERAILLLTREYRRNAGVGSKSSSSTIVYAYSLKQEKAGVYVNGRQDDFAAEIAFLKTRAGCPVSVATRVLGGSSLGLSGAGSSLSESDSKGSLSFPCPACGTINKRPKEGYVESCQNLACPNPKAVRC